ncbi:PhoH family protein [Actinobacillus equuli subsp. equuli]|uniref:PhoH family protein n=1 Tax=Actinobacillus equuli TaxID=718 RepID=UPI0024184313|nr:PhoH family protein [Actinobacillus equuli]MDG4951944.1 PhoH family protein [Actinobacillus equuli subsp. equuli]WGE49059.1 PhoH family protein [Actinobacillus equuli subsp. equuli]WGE55431.1 PhoH family protein [Actinobacillus equuli subsp. equuli]WGE57523.1 PhoH family protein [Actinobacillus equuli subsp. equuli]WGE65755.1 PhoH family protein [Actinobacillus equuli subsp. equuli]
MNEILLTLEPQDNARLQSLCGAFDEHLTLIEKSFNLTIARNGFSFSIQSDDENHYSVTLIQNAAKLLKQLYIDTAPIKGKIKELDLEDIHLAIQESRMLLQNQWNTGGQGEISIKTKRGVIKPRGEHQQAYLRNILSHDISFGIGPAGTGKTFLAVAAAVESLERQEIRRILLTRPAVEAGEKLGFLPGDLGQKIEPYLRPLYDALFEMLGFEKAQKLMERNVIEIAPLAYMRGRTLNDAFIILDESQNTTTEQMKMFLTRIGFNSKAVITGDVTQVDLPRSQKSGLKHAMEVLKDVPDLSFNYFDSHDIVRHPVVAKIVQAYDVWEAEDEQRREQRRLEKLALEQQKILEQAEQL